MKKLAIEFYERADVVQIAKDLLGKIIITKFDGLLTSCRIVETEAYVAFTDKASHAYKGKRTARNEAMYGAPGTAYVYICYGMHRMFNIVTNKKETPDAVLIRAAEPIAGSDIMLQRTNKKNADYTLTKGPGNVGKAMGFEKIHNGASLRSNLISVADDGYKTDDTLIGSSKRIGIDNTDEAVHYLYRFYIKGNKFVSGYPNK
jgi:DNA-3-methyladenine glycosylase